MRAIVYEEYGPPEVLHINDLPRPELADDQLLVEVHAISVTTADWRFRAARFPTGFGLIGRLMAGLFRPRNQLTGREFSGRVVAVGSKVTRFAVGDEVFGANPAGANAELVAVDESAAVAHKPATLTHAEAVALPFGAITSIDFLRDRAKIQPGERVLIVGASGGVGVYLVQMAKHLGAEVTAVCSTANLPLVRSLGADHVIDYTEQDPALAGRTYDVIVDPVGKTKFANYRDALAPKGRHVFIEAGMREVWQSMVTPLMPGPTVLFGVADDSAAWLDEVNTMVEAGAIRPVIGHRFAMDEIVDAHRVVDRRRRRGAVVVDIVPSQA